MLWSAVKDVRAKYKEQMKEAYERRKLLSSHSDWFMIEKFVQQCNDNPNLSVSIRLLDGTAINMCTYKPVEKENMNQILNHITVEDY